MQKNRSRHFDFLFFRNKNISGYAHYPSGSSRDTKATFMQPDPERDESMSVLAEKAFAIMSGVRIRHDESGKRISASP